MARGKYKRGSALPSGREAGGVAPGAVGAALVPGGATGPAEVPMLGVAVMSSWGWRIMAVFAMVGAGVCLTFYLDGNTVFAGLWTVIALAWSAFAAFLWRKHLAWDRG